MLRLSRKSSRDNLGGNGRVTMKLKLGKVYRGNEQEFQLVPENRAELLMLYKLQLADIGSFTYWGGYPQGHALNGHRHIDKKGKCKGCRYTRSSVMTAPCDRCRNNPCIISEFMKPKKGPSALQLLLKGLSNKKKRKG